MKIKYLKLNKEEKKQAKKRFNCTENGKFIRKKLNSVKWCGLLCILISIYIIIDAHIKKLGVFDYIYGFIILIFGIIFLTLAHKIYIKKINDFITKK